MFTTDTSAIKLNSQKAATMTPHGRHRAAPLLKGDQPGLFEEVCHRRGYVGTQEGPGNPGSRNECLEISRAFIGCLLYSGHGAGKTNSI